MSHDARGPFQPRARSLGPADVHVRYQLTGDSYEAGGKETVDVLSDEERERAGRFVFPRDRLTYIAAHVLLRHTLSDVHENIPPEAWAFDRNSHGKPALAAPFAASGVHFNLTHTDGVVACAVCLDRDVGIDVERLDRTVDPLEIAGSYFSRAEVSALEACSDAERRARFTELWTLKEAHVKAVGLGLSFPLQSTTFTFVDPGRLQFEDSRAADARKWQFAAWAPTPQHRMAVAVTRAADRPRRILVKALDTAAPAMPVLWASE